MGPRLSIVAGLLTGVLAAVLLMAGVFTFAPEPTSPSPSPAASLAGPTAPPSKAVTPSPSASSASLGPMASASAVPSPSAGSFGIGEPAPPLVVPQVGGGTIDLASLRGKPVWVNFTATWCPSCKDEFPLMTSYAARFAGDGLVVIAVDVKEEEGIVAAFAQGLGATFPLGLDTDGRVAEAWGAVALPVHFWIGADGVIRDRSIGEIGPDVMVRGLRSILPGVDIQP